MDSHGKSKKQLRYHAENQNCTGQYVKSEKTTITGLATAIKEDAKITKGHIECFDGVS